MLVVSIHDRALCKPKLHEKCSYSEFSGPYFLKFELNTEIYSANLRI